MRHVGAPPGSPRARVPPTAHRIGTLLVSEKALALIESHEISSEAAYRKRFSRPVWPGGQSGATVGIGYDLGHHKAAEIVADWAPHLGRAAAEDLARAAGRYGPRAEAIARSLQHVHVPYEAAKAVWRVRSLPKYAAQTAQAFPGVEGLPPDAQGALLSLVYNRGPGMAGDRRREMRTIRAAVAAHRVGASSTEGTLRLVADQIRAMKRLWAGKGLPGLLRRRDEEAALVEHARFPDPEPPADVDPIEPRPPEPLPSLPDRPAFGSLGWFRAFWEGPLGRMDT